MTYGPNMKGMSTQAKSTTAPRKKVATPKKAVKKAAPKARKGVKTSGSMKIDPLVLAPGVRVSKTTI